jgi:hypothetical protein
MGEKGTAYMILVEEPEGRRQLRRPRRKWVDNILKWIPERRDGVI